MNGLMKKTCILFLAILMTALNIIPAAAESKEFSDYLYDEWKETVEADYLTMHTSVYDYRNLGLKKPEVTFGNIDEEEYADTVVYAQEALDKLHEFDVNGLDETERHDYIAFEYYLECLTGMYSCPEFQSMFRPYTGYLSNVLDFFADFPFYEKQDIEDYLTLIAELPSYIDQMKDLTREQAEAGYFLDDLGFTDEMYELNEFVEKGESNPMIINFDDNINKYDGLNDSEKSAYKEKNRELILNSVIPAIRDVRSFLSTMKGKRSVPTGALLEYTPDNGTADGLEYYKSLVKYYSSSDDDLEEIFDYLTKAAVEMGDYFTMILESDEDFTVPDVIKDMESLEDVLSYLRSNMEGFPQGPDVDYVPSYLPPGSNDFAMAYYIPAPVDNLKQNIIRVNKENTNDIDTLYYTLAHEGFPGHLYQFTWFQASDGYRPIRHEISFMGYEEGWANYVEKIMLERSGLDMTSADYLFFNDILAYIIYSGADIAVNGLGYDVDELAEWMDSVGFSGDYAEEIFELSVEMPGSYIPYGYGVSKFFEFRERAEQALGEDFDEEEFHEVLLKYGPRPFSLVEEDLSAYVSAKGKKLPDDFTFFGAQMPKKPFLEENPWIKYLSGVLVVVIAAIAVIIINKKRRKMEEEISESLTE